MSIAELPVQIWGLEGEMVIVGAPVTVTFSVCAVDEPHELFAVTAIFPLEPVVTVIVLVVLVQGIQMVGDKIAHHLRK